MNRHVDKLDSSCLSTTWLLPMSVPRARRERNLYGYLWNSIRKKAPWSGTQLRTLLKLQNHNFRPIQRNIWRLMGKYLDVELKGCQQMDKLRAIENELKELYPDLFGGEESKKKLYFATRFVMHEHSIRRSQSKMTQQCEVATQDVAPKSASQILPRSNEPSINIDPDITCTTHDPNQYRDIHSFLETSLPPMTHLMDAFINFGCINAAFLHTISSWSTEKIRDVLNQLSLDPKGRKITEMDKFILENHFKEYFSQR